MPGRTKTLPCFPPWGSMPIVSPSSGAGRCPARAVRSLREQARVFITFNEPNVFVVGGYLGGIMPPGRRSPREGFAAFANVFRAHAALYDMIHAQGRAKATVGVAHNMVAFHPAAETSAMDRGGGRGGPP